MPFEHAHGQPAGRVTISGGVATWPSDGDDVDSLLRNADAALYEAKRGGRNRVLAFSRPELATGRLEDGYLGPPDDAELEKSRD